MSKNENNFKSTAKSHTNEIAEKRENGLEASSEKNDILITFWRDPKSSFVKPLAY